MPALTTDLLDRHTGLGSDYFGTGLRAITPLATAHANATESLGAVDFACAFFTHHAAQFTGADHLAAADNRFIGQPSCLGSRPGKRFGQPDTETVHDLQILAHLFAARVIHRPAKIVQQRHRRQSPCLFGSIGTTDFCAVARCINAVRRGATVFVDRQHPLPGRVVETQLASGQVSQLSFRAQVITQRQCIAIDGQRVTVGELHAHAGHTVLLAADNFFGLHAQVHRHFGAVQLGQQLHAVEQQARAREQFGHRADALAEWRGVEHGGHIGTGFDVLAGDQVKQRSAAHEHHATADGHRLRLERDL
ncbi:hypothetical protein ALP81_05640 [Pseudomonas savastanoi pv. fraxini]|nr:hypothetical protein ALP81_05640 [Pseudomonas savastanoi pv. fraxini]